MNRRVVVTGLGVISSIGIGWEEFWESLLKGKSGISPVTAFDTTHHFTHNGGQVKHFRPQEFLSEGQMKVMNRSSQMALSAAKLALKDSLLTQPLPENMELGVSFGTTLGDAQAIEDIDGVRIKGQKPVNELFLQLPTHAAPSVIAAEIGCKGPMCMFSTACAAGNYAIAYGYDLIRMGKAGMVFAGGSDPMSRIEYTGFNQLSAVAPEKCQPFDRNRKGMIPGEGAGVIILETLESALRRNAHIYAEISGYGLSCDAYHMTMASVEGLAECMKKAMRDAGISPGEVDYVSAHGTGTAANDRNECAAIREVFGTDYQNVPVSSIKSMLGHTMGAASALEAIACSLAVKNDILPPTINFETPDPECDIDCVPNKARKHTVNIAMNNSYAFGGNNASVVFKKFVG